MGFEKAHETKHDEMQGGAECLMGNLPKCRVTSNRMAQQLLTSGAAVFCQLRGSGGSSPRPSPDSLGAWLSKAALGCAVPMHSPVQ